MPEKANSPRSRACDYSHCTLHATDAIPDVSSYHSFVFGKSGPRTFFRVAVIENFFNQVGTHLLRTGQSRLKDSGTK
jgi:hypothetical protein